MMEERSDIHPDIHPQSLLGKVLSETVEDVTRTLSPHHTVVEFVTYDPEDFDTYPSVCQTPDEVKDRFGFTGGERLIFTAKGSYIGRVVSELGGLDEGSEGQAER
jgi:hypothetical protein